jgi:hypothetical protein
MRLWNQNHYYYSGHYPGAHVCSNTTRRHARICKIVDWCSSDATIQYTTSSSHLRKLHWNAAARNPVLGATGHTGAAHIRNIEALAAIVGAMSVGN